jgi:hypothetical protein
MHLISRNSGKFGYIAQSSIFATLLAAVIFASATWSAAFAQSATTGAIGGTITDSGGALLPATAVTVTSVDTGLTRTAKSNASGEYRVTELVPGTYSATFTAGGRFRNLPGELHRRHRGWHCDRLSSPESRLSHKHSRGY